MKKYYEFNALGNYSESFGWDNGISANISKEISEAEAVEQNFSLAHAPNDVYVLFYNEHNGTRNISGIIVADSHKEAKSLLKKYEDLFPIIEYEEA